MLKSTCNGNLTTLSFLFCIWQLSAKSTTFFRILLDSISRLPLSRSPEWDIIPFLRGSGYENSPHWRTSFLHLQHHPYVTIIQTTKKKKKIPAIFPTRSQYQQKFAVSCSKKGYLQVWLRNISLPTGRIQGGSLLWQTVCNSKYHFLMNSVTYSRRRVHFFLVQLRTKPDNTLKN